MSVSGILQEDLSQLPRSNSTDFFVKKLLPPYNPHRASVPQYVIETTFSPGTRSLSLTSPLHVRW